MIERGARILVLLSRSGGAKERLDSLLEEIKCPDARVIVQKCDISNELQVRQCLKDLKASLPSICGVIHAAMVLRVCSSFSFLVICEFKEANILLGRSS
jgi:NAD(P)-dependent dehydrogenase (short-subunit alcohol dehydrogenase family)